MIELSYILGMVTLMIWTGFMVVHMTGYGEFTFDERLDVLWILVVAIFLRVLR